MKLVRIGEVKSVFGYRSNSSIYALIKDGLFTRPVSTQKRSVGWPDQEVESICKARVAGCTDDRIRALVDRLHQTRISTYKPE